MKEFVDADHPDHLHLFRDDDDHDGDEPVSESVSISEQRDSLANQVNREIVYAGLHPATTWGELGPQVEYRSYPFPTLYGAIALQLLAFVLQADLFICDACGDPIDVGARKRRPKAGTAAYCKRCQETGEGYRAWRRRSRLRDKEE